MQAKKKIQKDFWSFLNPILLGLIFLSVPKAGPSYETPYFQGELLISVNPNMEAEGVNRSLKEKLNVTEIKLISDLLNAFLVKYTDPITVDQAIEIISGVDGIILVQPNHKIESRALPNDPMFDIQWQYLNKGVGGSKADADIDVDEVWDYTTGGLTTEGDTIVVAAIDNQFDINHPDLAANMWKNIHEIPNNNTDDDGNGYIDDVRGWSMYNNNDDITSSPEGGGHGTPVAGIIGAVGNNGIGMAGVNWKIKVMGVSHGSASEAEAVAAYTYVAKNRKLYNDTKGEKGAFVVATNSSFGFSWAFENEYPLWCSMYDTLGSYGILNIGTGPNFQIDVDVQGDIPTHCSSDHLLSVTNIDSEDELFDTTINGESYGAGWGAKSIDLGAPGNDAPTLYDRAKPWPPEISNGYGYFGGTSAAGPHVAGAVGLLYSANCPEFAKQAMTNPSAAALRIKKIIMDGVDPISTLSGKSVTGGRLNVKNSYDSLMISCTGTPLIFESLTKSFDLKYSPINSILNIYVDNSESVKIRLKSISGKTYFEESRRLTKGWNQFNLSKQGLGKTEENLAGISNMGMSLLIIESVTGMQVEKIFTAR